MDSKTQEFLQKLKDSGNWNDDYDYSAVKYISYHKRVKIKYLNNGLEIEIKLEDSPNIKFKKEGNLNIVNFKSPLGKSLLGCIEGDTVKIGELDTSVEVVSIKN